MEDKDRIDELEKLISDLTQKTDNQKPKMSVKKIIAIVLLCLQVLAFIGMTMQDTAFIIYLVRTIGTLSFSIVAVILLHVDYKQNKPKNQNSASAQAQVTTRNNEHNWKAIICLILFAILLLISLFFSIMFIINLVMEIVSIFDLLGQINGNIFISLSLIVSVPLTILSIIKIRKCLRSISSHK